MTHEDSLFTMARTIFGEARNQGYEGMVAVGWVIRNRADSPGWWGRNIEEVCLKPWQFSCWNVNDPNREIIMRASLEDPLFRESLRAAIRAYDRQGPDPTNGATSYHTIKAPKTAPKWPPHWVESMVPTVTIRDHKFYREV